MPPVIYKSSRYPNNTFQGRPYEVGASFWMEAQFGTFDVSITADYTDFKIEMPTFQFESNIVSDSFNVTFPISDIGFSVDAGQVSSFEITFPKFSPTFFAGDIALEASVIALSASGVCYQVPSINVSASAVNISASGDITGSVTIVQPDPESGSEASGSYVFDGDLYLVLNLKTKSHSTYRDGNNNAIAQTGELTFSTQKEKNVSDAYVLAKSTGDVRFIAKSGENTERTHDLIFRVNDDANLVNKKVRLAKGLKGQVWQFSVLSPDGDHLEVQAIDLIVNKTKRRV